MAQAALVESDYASEVDCSTVLPAGNANCEGNSQQPSQWHMLHVGHAAGSERTESAAITRAQI